MAYNPPIAYAKQPADPRGLWRRLFLQAMDSGEPGAGTVEHACYAAALLSGASMAAVTDALVEMGLRAQPEDFPKPWLASLRGRVLDMGQRPMLSSALAALAASWGWMPTPVARASLPEEIDPETDPYGADLMTLFQHELGSQPRFGYSSSMLRLAILKTAVGIGQPLPQVVTDLITRGCIFPADAITGGCRETLRMTATHPLVKEQLASWQATYQAMAEVIPLRSAQTN